MASFICADNRDGDHEETGQDVSRPHGWSGSYPVEDISPALHRDALENRQHGEEDVVEVGDAAVGALPLAPALGAVLDTEAAAAGEGAGRRVVLHHEA